MVNSVLQSIIEDIENKYHGGKRSRRFGCCWWYHCQYLLKNIVWYSAPWVHYWILHVMNHVLIHLRNLIEALGVVFHVIMRKLVLIKRKVPLILLVAIFWYGEDIPYTIPNHVLMALILLVFDWGLNLAEPTYFDHVSSEFIFSLREY